ncbi:hypothetical protein [Jonesia quinghaiensis]|uniref:hypothetical protein n=1 Tax=Jonesia quinghaiensis TaxID=262806 RepID=UPI0004087B5C|nr:hypothetical protein [Jonesia quinghaiensis]
MAGKWFYNTKTGQVKQGRGWFSWLHVMGPYDTREQAQKALDIAAARTASWEAEDKQREADSD